MKTPTGKIAKILICLVLVCLTVTGVFYLSDAIGVSESDIEKDIRKSQKIESDWTVCGDVSDTMAAFISYPEDKTDHTFSVYVNRPGFSFGYFFRAGGGIFEIEESILEYSLEGYSERAFISMNKQKAERLELDNGTVIDIDSSKPFVFVFPDNEGSVSFFSAEGKIEIVKYHD